MLGLVRPASMFAPALTIISLLGACDDSNQYVAPPPPTVTVAAPEQRKITPYFENTGSTAAVNQTNLVARVQGYVEDIKYKDGSFVTKGTTLFVIEPEPYRVKLEQAKAAKAGAAASLKQLEADYQRQSDLVKRQVVSRATLDAALAARDSAQSKIDQAELDIRQAEINLGYTEVNAPFDGIVTARLVSVGELVGAGSTTVLATITQIDPIYVNFTIAETDVLEAREQLRRSGETLPILSASCRSRSACRPTRTFRSGVCSTMRRPLSTNRPAPSRCAGFSRIPSGCSCQVISSGSGCRCRTSQSQC